MSEKLQKILAQIGLGSRRELECWITDGRIKVNGQLAKLGDRATTADKITVDDKPIQVHPCETQIILLNKPEGVLCSRVSEKDRPTVFDGLPKLPAGRWISVGRLDLNTSGLLLFTNNGELANQLMHPSSNIEREYLVRVLGEPDNPALGRLLKGVRLDDGMAKFESLIGPRGKGKNQWFTVVIKEGRKREVRRLWESQGCKVSRLKRIRFGTVQLPRDLKLGAVMRLSSRQIKDLLNQ